MQFLLDGYSIWFQLQTMKHTVCCGLWQVNTRGRWCTLIQQSTSHCHNLLFFLWHNDGWSPTTLPAHYCMFGLKLVHSLVDCWVWHSVVITKFLFKQSSLFEWFIVREINVDQVATLFLGKNHFNHSVQILSQTRMKHFYRQIVQACCLQFSNILIACFVFLPSYFSFHRCFFKHSEWGKRLLPVIPGSR